MEDYAAGTHGGTHIDAPSHMATTEADVANKWTVDQIPISRLMGPLRIINIKAKADRDPNAEITVSDITAHERKYGRIPPKAIVFMNSGWGARWPNKTLYFGKDYDKNPRKFEFPGFSKESATFLTTMRDIVGIGVDTPSFDHGSSPNYSVHRIFFAKDIYGLENVAHVEKAPEAGAIVFVAPFKIRGGSGGPCRVTAMWGDSRAMIAASVRPQFSLMSGLLLILMSFIMIH